MGKLCTLFRVGYIETLHIVILQNEYKFLTNRSNSTDIKSILFFRSLNENVNSIKKESTSHSQIDNCKYRQI